MIRIDAAKLFSAYTMVVATNQRFGGPEIRIHSETFETLRGQVRALHEQLSTAGLVLSAMSVAAALDAMEQSEVEGPLTVLRGHPFTEFRGHLGAVTNRMADEVRARIVVTISNENAHYYNAESTLFGDDVARVFPSATYDIAEAGKCFAVARYTASVFHLMRTIEAGIHRLCDVLHVTINGTPGWQKILNDKLEPAIIALPEGTPAEKERKTALQQARAHLHAIRLGWRNDTMHPKATYTEEEARDLIGHVGTFMRHLAVRL